MPATYETLFLRTKTNPILTAADWPYPIHTVFNAGATLLRDGTTLLLCRVEDRTGRSHLCAARSKDGVGGWIIDPHPTFPADPENHPEELWGVEDLRIPGSRSLAGTPSPTPHSEKETPASRSRSRRISSTS